MSRPADYDKWSIPRSRSGTGSLAYNVCVPQLLAAVECQQHLREGIQAIGLRHTTVGHRPPGTRQGIVLRVGQYPSQYSSGEGGEDIGPERCPLPAGQSGCASL